jgi:hypothetical protein
MMGLDVWGRWAGHEAMDGFDKHVDALDDVLLDIVIPPEVATKVMDPMIAAREGLAIVLPSGDVLAPGLEERIERYGVAFRYKPSPPKALLTLLAPRLDGKGDTQPDSSCTECVPVLRQREI